MLIIIIFIIGYLAIILEEPLSVNKTATALLTGVVCWVAYTANPGSGAGGTELSGHVAEISGILFFLMGAMAIVELIDLHDGFTVITNRIHTTSERKLLWIICFITFLMSAVLDNLTTAIIMISLLRKLVTAPQRRMIFAGMVVIAANAGGAWSPIGDVTTTMLWIGGQITPVNIMVKLFLPSLIAMLIPLVYFSFSLNGSIQIPQLKRAVTNAQKITFFAGVCALVFVPIFKLVTGLPPYMGMLFCAAAFGIFTEFLPQKTSSIVLALKKIDIATILFFLGILMAVAAIESADHLATLADLVNQKIQNVNIVVIAIGLLSSVIDNVPLVAATMGMYHLNTYPADHYFWEFLAYAAGTGGSCLILGSAAGVAAMGMEKITFLWYLKKFTLITVAGYLAGALVYIAQEYFT